MGARKVRQVSKPQDGRPQSSGPAPPAKKRRWAAGLAPTLLLPAVLAGASSSLLAGSAHQPAGSRPPGITNVLEPRPGPRELGVTGQLPQEQRPGPELIDRAGEPGELGTGSGPPIDVPDGPLGIPAPVLAAYVEGADRVSSSDPGCGLDWPMLASIGRIESGHARSGRIDANGTTASAILGPRLDGGGVAAVPDTDGGALDGDPVWDRAVGPMQFLPTTWRQYGADAAGSGSPNNVNDAAAATGKVLCSSGSDLRDPRNLATAVFRYNHSEAYVRTVLVWAAAYANGVTPTPADLAPQDPGRDILAGERLPDGPAVPSTPPGAPAWPLPVEPGPGQPPAAVAGVPPALAPSSGASPVEPAPVEPEPPSVALPEPPSVALPEPPSVEPPMSEPPATTPPSTESFSPEPPSSLNPPASTESSTSSSTSSPTSTSTSSPTSTESSIVPVRCEATALAAGRFLTESQVSAGETAPRAGSARPSAVDPGELVYVNGIGSLEPCVVPSEFDASSDFDATPSDVQPSSTPSR